MRPEAQAKQWARSCETKNRNKPIKLKIFFEDKLMADTENARYTPAGVQPLGNEPKAQTQSKPRY